MAMRIGCHVRISGGLAKAVDRAVERGCETMQIFASNPRSWRRGAFPPGSMEAFRFRCGEEGISPVFVHAGYLINLASPDGEIWERSVKGLEADMQVAESLGAAAVVTHLGSHGGKGDSFGVERVVRALKLIFGRCGAAVGLLLETTAGGGNSVGHTFSHLGAIMEAPVGRDRLGICFDTCHAFVAGYELRTREGLEETLRELDREVGLDRVALVHANDSKGDLGSRLDRHEHLGKGRLGMEALRIMANHPALRGLPWILETPEMSVESDRENLRVLHSLRA